MFPPKQTLSGIGRAVGWREVIARRPLVGLFQQSHEGGKIAFLMENSRTAIAPAEHVVTYSRIENREPRVAF